MKSDHCGLKFLREKINMRNLEEFINGNSFDFASFLTGAEKQLALTSINVSQLKNSIELRIFQIVSVFFYNLTSGKINSKWEFEETLQRSNSSSTDTQ